VPLLCVERSVQHQQHSITSLRLPTKDRKIDTYLDFEQSFCFIRLFCLVLHERNLENMVTETTRGVQVSVIAEFLPNHSRQEISYYAFAYHITIENHSDYAVQLLRRHWYIYDANGTTGEVEGEGVIGLQPILVQGDTHKYSSGCNLRTTIGKMRGTYLMERLSDGVLFEVNIPEFTLVAPFILN
jgi:ApaG protein